MSNSRHISDNEIRRKLRNYQEIPPDHIWEGIAIGLARDRKQTRMLWYRRIAAAAVFLIAAGGTWFLMRNSTSAEQALAREINPASIAESSPEPALLTSDLIAQVAPLPETYAPRAEAAGITMLPRLVPGISSEDRSDVARAEVALDRLASRSIDGIALKNPVNAAPLNRQYRPVGLPDPGGIDLLADRESSDLGGQLGVGGQVTPLYSYRDVYTTSRKAGDAVIYNDMESPVMAFAGGFNLKYEPVRRLSIQSGIYYSRLGMRVDNVFQAEVKSAGYRVGSTSEQLSLYHSSGEITPDASNRYTRLANLSPASVRNLEELSTNGNDAPAVQSREYGSLLQHLDYVELPLILRYRMVDRRFGINVLGGVSTNLLVGSKAYYEEGNNRNLLGKTTDIKPINYSSIVGLGLQYSLNNNFQLNFEPTFRYYLNSINTDSRLQSHPYSFGVFTGVSYFF